MVTPDLCDCADPHPPCTECDGGFCYTVEHCTDCLTPYDPPYQADRLREFEE